MDNSEKTTIQIKKDLRKALKDIKITEYETYNEIITRTLNAYKNSLKDKEKDD